MKIKEALDVLAKHYKVLIGKNHEPFPYTQDELTGAIKTVIERLEEKEEDKPRQGITNTYPEVQCFVQEEIGDYKRVVGGRDEIEVEALLELLKPKCQSPQ